MLGKILKLFFIVYGVVGSLFCLKVVYDASFTEAVRNDPFVNGLVTGISTWILVFSCIAIILYFFFFSIPRLIDRAFGRNNMVYKKLDYKHEWMYYCGICHMFYLSYEEASACEHRKPWRKLSCEDSTKNWKVGDICLLRTRNETGKYALGVIVGEHQTGHVRWPVFQSPEGEFILSEPTNFKEFEQKYSVVSVIRKGEMKRALRESKEVV